MPLSKIKLNPIIFPLLLLVFSIFASIIIHRATWFVQDKHFSSLAESFIHGDLYLSPFNLPPGDYADFRGKQYLFFGPVPSIILMPAVALFGKNFPQINLSFASMLIIFASVYLICKKLRFDKIDSLWLALFFVFGTNLSFVGLIDISAYIPQVVGTMFVVLAILEYFTKKRWLLIGILVASAGATRITLYALSVFFILEIYQHTRKDLAKNLALLLLPIMVSLIFLGAYNYRRFRSPFDTGYTRNVSVLDKDYTNNHLGWFSPIHIPANLYTILLRGPEPVLRGGIEMVLQFPYVKANGMGMAIWYTSPLFIYLLLARKKAYTTSAIIGVVALAIPSLIYMGIGASQYGYRYGLDFMPMLFLILITAFREKLSTFPKILIASGVIINCFYMLSIWNSYPLLNFWVYFR